MAMAARKPVNVSRVMGVEGTTVAPTGFENIVNTLPVTSEERDTFERCTFAPSKSLIFGHF